MTKSNLDSIIGFVDTNYANDPNNHRIFCGFVFKVFCNSVMRRTRNQTIVVPLSSAEAEYEDIALALCLIIKLMSEILDVEVTPVTCYNTCMKTINPALKLPVRSDHLEPDILETGSTRPVEVGEQQATRHFLGISYHLSNLWSIGQLSITRICSKEGYFHILWHTWFEHFCEQIKT